MKKIKLLSFIISLVLLSACASKNNEIPRKSPCACIPDIVKVS